MTVKPAGAQSKGFCGSRQGFSEKLERWVGEIAQLVKDLINRL